MANFGPLTLTNDGIRAQYAAMAGVPLKFTKIGMGSGEYAGDIAGLTGLVSEKVSVNLTKGYMQNGMYVVSGFFSNENLQTSFLWREIGLYFEDENGDDVLYCYANAGDEYDSIPATTDDRYTKTICIATAINNEANISIVESEGIVYVDTVTFAKLELSVNEHIGNKKNPHGVTAEQIGAVPSVMANNTTFKTVMGDHQYIRLNIDETVPDIPAVSNYLHIMSVDANSNMLAAFSIPVDYGTQVYRYSTTDKKWKEFAFADAFLSLTGGILTGSIMNANGASRPIIHFYNPVTGVDGGQLWTFGKDDAINKGGFILRTLTEDNQLVDLVGKSDGTLTWNEKKLFGEHNKPSGSYVGNGSATERTVAMGGVGNGVLITSSSGMVLVTGYGAIGKKPSETVVNGISWSEIMRKSDGNLKIASSNSLINASGTVYYYQVL